MNDTAIEAAIEAVLGNMIYVVSKREAKVFAHAAISADLTQREADGFVMVPVEPSEAMLDAGDEVIGMPWGSVIPPSANPAHYIMGMVWQQMIAARPQVKG